MLLSVASCLLVDPSNARVVLLSSITVFILRTRDLSRVFVILAVCKELCIFLVVWGCMQLLDVVEHADFASFGLYVTNHFAVSSRLGTVEEFKGLIDRAHALGLRVLISLCHAYSSKNVMDGLGCIDGGDSNYFVSGPSGEVEDAKVFDFAKTEVTRFLLSNIAYWLGEYQYVSSRPSALFSCCVTPR